ncbi:MAG: family 43 glycosylhydrolase [Planctomycetota bacterium]
MKLQRPLLSIALLLAASLGSRSSCEEPPANNPLRVDGRDFYGADPSVVIADDGRLYLFPTTDNRDWEKQFGWSCYSTDDLSRWTNHGVIFSNEDSSWGTHKAWAPDITKKDGKYYFFYYFNNGGKGKGGVGVAVADDPTGPFKELTKTKLCRGHDPAVFADDDGRYWMYLQDKVYELGDDMVSFKSGPVDLKLEYRPQKFEAAYVFKREGIYYFTIARGWNNLIYYTGESPTGPFRFRGEIMKPYGGNNHHSIIKFKDRWVLFYHEWVKKDPVHQRRLRAEFLKFNEDGTIRLVQPTDQGVRLPGALPTASTSDQAEDNENDSAIATAIRDHSRAVQLFDAKIRDPFIARGPDGDFFLTGTTAGTHWGETVGIRLWKSPNLVDWEDLGFVWTLGKDGHDQSSWHLDRPAKEGVKNGRAIWAPEIHFLNGTWWIPHSVNVAGHGLLKSTSGRPEGPYIALPAIASRGIDAHLFQENEKTYYLWGADNLVELSADLKEPVGQIRKLRPNGRHELGYEGVLLKKIGDKYLLIASGRYGYELSDTYDLYYCVAQSLTGPYGPRRMAVKNAGHGNLFRDNMGRWWCTAFDHPFVTGENRWTPWIVPLDIVETEDGIEINVLDERFRPTEADQQQVDELSRTGVPAGREGKRPWDRQKPKVWIYTDMSDPTLEGNNHAGTINDPDDVSAMASYLLMANEFETLGIVVSSTHRSEHRETPNQADWAKSFLGDAYQRDFVGLDKQFGGYPESFRWIQSSIKETAEKFSKSKRYRLLKNYRSVALLLEELKQLPEGEQINVLCWGSLTEPAVLVAHCIATNQTSLLRRFRLIAHWTNSPLHQGSREHPENVANCREDSNACSYLKRLARAGTIEYYECGAIGQHGIVSGSPKGKDYFDEFRSSRLGTIFVEGKFVFRGVDHSDSATYWTLLGRWGVGLDDLAADGTNSVELEKKNETTFRKHSKQIHGELLKRSQAAAGGTSNLTSPTRDR